MNNFDELNSRKTKKIAIFASGSGTNAENIAKYFASKKSAEVSLILTNKSDAFVIQRAKTFNIPTIIFNKEDFRNTDVVLNLLLDHKIDFIILAGFLWLIPEKMVRNFEKRIINIHPALLPDFGGKGMFGHHVHEKVIESKKEESGITIHFVNEKYDDGDIIFQAKCKIDEKDNAESLAQKIHHLEYEHFPKIIEEIITKADH
jgi:phosphoribosylglycinamide formyltransferase-1